MNFFGLLAILAVVVTAATAAPQDKDNLKKGIHSQVKNLMLSLKQLLPLHHKIANTNAKPLDLNLTELITAMEGTVRLSWSALSDALKSLDVLLSEHEELLSLIVQAHNYAAERMTSYQSRFTLAIGGWVEKEEIPRVAHETVDAFQGAAENFVLEMKYLVSQRAPEYVPQTEEIGRKVNWEVSAAVERVLFILKNAGH